MATLKLFRYLLANMFLVVGLFCIGTTFAEAKDKDKVAVDEKSVLVETAVVQLQPLSKQITLTGSLRANQGIIVRPEVAGRITQIYFKSGSVVVAGTPLVMLNQDILLAELQQSQAELQLERQNYARMHSLYKTLSISHAEFDTVTSKLNAAIAKVAQCQARLDQTLIKAPFVGKLGLSSVSLGDYVDAGQEIVGLAAIDPIEVEFSVPQVYLANLTMGQNVIVVSDSYVGQKFAGQIYAIDEHVNLSNRTIAARATIPNAAGKLLPGTFVEVQLNFANKAPVLVIPQVAVLYNAGQAYVYRAIKDKAAKTKVILGERDRENVVVVEGLNVHDTVITAGQLNLEDGSKIKFAQAEK